jgi:hypothetical protein
MWLLVSCKWVNPEKAPEWDSRVLTTSVSTVAAALVYSLFLYRYSRCRHHSDPQMSGQEDRTVHDNGMFPGYEP